MMASMRVSTRGSVLWQVLPSFKWIDRPRGQVLSFGAQRLGMTQAMVEASQLSAGMGIVVVSVRVSGPTLEGPSM